MWKIITRDKNEISISNDEYEGICKVLNQAKLFKLESGTIINSSDIVRIEQSADQMPITKEYRLPNVGDTDREKELRVLGGWQKPSMREKMIELFDKLKSNGIFGQYKNYEEWELATYKDDMEKAKEFAGQKK